MNRVTDSQLRAQVSTVNTMLGFTEPVPYPTPGAVVLYHAYGSTAVHRVVNDAGGQRDLCGLGTKREASLFLSGMITGLRAAQGVTA